MFKVRFTLLLAVLLLTSGCLVREDPLVTLARGLLNESEIRIVFIGGSVTYGVGLVSGQNNYIAFLKEDMERILPEQTLIFINAGKPGENSRTIFDHLERDVLTYQPHVIVIMLGHNDYLTGRIDPFEFNENIQRLLDRLPSKIGIVLATGPSLEFAQREREARMLDYDIYMAVLRMTAEERWLPLVDVFKEWEENRDSVRGKVADLYSDSTHPNERGHRLIADSFLRSFKASFRKAGKQ